ncbi:MAG: hypothetical protein BEN18_06935 [Epulopiscium sp. Nuni2H_MBin001]|nr:MAG: hypothetical protein BEN18_06935 [Epulopiscium sp. Nuni2H_MBin001]
MRKKAMNFKSLDSLGQVKKVLGEASEAINDRNRTIGTSYMPETLAGALGVGVGGAVGFSALYLGGSVVGLSGAGITSGLAAAGGVVGGGMIAGIAVLAAPAVILGASGVGIASHTKNKKLKQAKELCYIEALSKQNAIFKALKDEAESDKERIEYLTAINILLQAALKELAEDLGRIA